MRKALAIGCLAAACISGTAQAALFVNQYGIGAGYSADVSIKTAALPAVSGNGDTATVGEQNFGTAGIPGQSFTATTTGNVSRLELSHASSGTINLKLEMYDMGTGPFDEPWNVVDAVGVNLLGSRTNLASIGGASQQTVQFYFTGSDEIPVVAGRRYMVCFIKQSGDGTLTLYRNGNNTFYPAGDAYRFNTNGSDPDGVILRTSAPRDFALGVGYAQIPEPGSLGLAAVGSLALLRRRRA